MSRGFQRGSGRGGSADRGRGRGGRGGFQSRSFDTGPPDSVLEMGRFMHAVEGEMLCSSTMKDKVPYFNAPIYLENKSVIGKVDEILGPINEVYFSVKMGEGMVATSFQKGDKVFIGPDKLLPLERFLPKPKEAPERGRGARGAARGGGRGGARGFGRGIGSAGRGRGGSRGAPRGRGGFGGGPGGRGASGANRGRGRFQPY